MEATKEQFNDYVTNRVINMLGITTDQYNVLIFKAGLKANERNKKYLSYFVTTGAFWDCFSHNINFLNLKMIAEDDFFKLIDNGETAISNVPQYFDMITQKFELPKRVINLINKQYQLQLYTNSKTSDSKLVKKQRQTRASKNLNNQSKINLNTI